MTDGPSSHRPDSTAGEARALRSLARARSVTAEMANELLTHVPDLGDVAAGRLLDAWVEQSADTLRAVSDAMEERLLDTASAARTGRSSRFGTGAVSR